MTVPWSMRRGWGRWLWSVVLQLSTFPKAGKASSGSGRGGHARLKAVAQMTLSSGEGDGNLRCEPRREGQARGRRRQGSPGTLPCKNVHREVSGTLVGAARVEWVCREGVSGIVECRVDSWAWPANVIFAGGLPYPLVHIPPPMMSNSQWASCPCKWGKGGLIGRPSAGVERGGIWSIVDFSGHNI